VASIIPGFEYDIFISYRQKDNKGDRWVSEFVDSLKDELESTFKEEISLYFDVNPHDGLLETHDVGDSLKDKVKCLIFIPILSRTYCDPKSFSWEKEFMAFIEQASKDQFGMKVRLPGGNVASRVLPIRIHDLDASDIALCESVTGGVLRGVEFIYKSPGVNRPLRPKEEKAQENLNNTLYRDQINKVALAIKDIILGLKSGSVFPVIESDPKKEVIAETTKVQKKDPAVRPSKIMWSGIVSGTGLLTLLIIAVLIVYPKIFKHDKDPNPGSADKRISVAVLPFQNMTNDKKLSVLELSIQDDLINYLTNVEELKVDPSDKINGLLRVNGITDYAHVSPSAASKISAKLGTDVYISGSIIQSGAEIRINVQLTDSKSGDVLRSFKPNGSFDGESIFPIVKSLAKDIENYLIISRLKEEVYIDPQRTGSSVSPDAYRAFNIGQKAFANGDLSDAINYLKQAVGYDSNLVYATLHVGWAYLNLGNYDEAKAWCLKAYRKKDQMSQELSTYTDFVHAFFFETPNEAIKYLKRLKDIDDQWPHLHYDMGVSYSILEQYDRAVPEFNKALDMYREKGLKPWWAANYYMLGKAYHETGQFKKEKELYRKAITDFPENPGIIRRQAILAFSEGNTIDAEKLIEKYKSVRKESSTPETTIITGVAAIYSAADIPGKAEECYRQALSLKQDDPEKLYDLAWFLIDENRNINEGLELIERALEKQPDNYLFLDCKGWGLYRQGKVKEAHALIAEAWNLKLVYNHLINLHLEEVKKAMAGIN
jgi:tetratricopeptide (TPR) repeat protein/TolB-like protein